MLLEDALGIARAGGVETQARRVRRIRERYLEPWATTPAVRLLDYALAG